MESFDNRFTSQVDFNSEEDNETESENEMLCTPKRVPVNWETKRNETKRNENKIQRNL